jgi:hypothetical protein
MAPLTRKGALGGLLALIAFGTAVPGLPVLADESREEAEAFQRLHKYRIDAKHHPQGIPDWERRRDYTYSVRAVIRVMPPCNTAALNDDYQDARVLRRTKDYVELEVVCYPLNTNAGAIRANPNWKKDYAGMKEYLAAGVTTNWDAAMQKDLLRALLRAGIDVDKLTDKEVVEKVAGWLLASSKYRYMFGTYYVHFPKGKPEVFPGLEGAFRREKGDRNWTVQQQFDHELLGKGMFENRTYGTCTSAAVYLTTVLRAVGIPTRMILTIPVVDPCDDAQVEMVRKNLKNHRVRTTVDNALLGLGKAFIGHTYNEVYVGHRWRRLNYSRLGQNSLDRHCLGLMVKVHTFRDLSEANLAATWGRRFALGERDQVFRYSNPYRTMELSDLFGRHCKLANPQVVEQEHRHITISKAYWFGSKETPESIRASKGIRLDDGAGHLMIYGEEWFRNADHLPYKRFMMRADRNFLFRAKGRPDVKGYLSMSFFTLESRNIRDMEVIIPAGEYAKMAKGVAYTLQPVNANPTYRWKVQKGVHISR